MKDITSQRVALLMTYKKEDWEPHITIDASRGDVWYTGDITLIGVHELIRTLNSILSNNEFINSQRTKATLYIQSSGGCVSSALLLYDYLCLNYNMFRIVGLTKLCSCATFFLFTKCETFVFPNIYVLFHPMNFEFSDNQEGVDKRNTFYKRLATKVDNIYATKKFKVNWRTSNIYLYAKELIAKGIIKDIYEF